MKPIEPGCLVLITSANNTDLIGKCGTVIEQEDGFFVNQEGDMVDGRGWWVVEVPSHDVLACRPASSLIRIDDPDVEQEVAQAMESVE